MIITALLSFLAFLLDLTFRFIDTMSTLVIPSGITEFVTEMFRLGFVFNELFPVTELYLLLSTVIAFELWVAGYKVSLWIYEQIRHILRS